MGFSLSLSEKWMMNLPNFHPSGVHWELILERSCVILVITSNYDFVSALFKIECGIKSKFYFYLDALFFLNCFYHSPQNSFVSVLAGKSRGCSLDLFPSYSFIFVWRVLYVVNSVAWNGTQIKGCSQAALFYLFILPSS